MIGLYIYIDPVSTKPRTNYVKESYNCKADFSVEQ